MAKVTDYLKSWITWKGTNRIGRMLFKGRLVWYLVEHDWKFNAEWSEKEIIKKPGQMPGFQ